MKELIKNWQKILIIFYQFLAASQILNQVTTTSTSYNEKFYLL